VLAVPADHPVEFSQANKANLMTKQLKDYGNGILASSPDLAKIGMECLERERKMAALRIACRDGGQYETWNISDRH